MMQSPLLLILTLCACIHVIDANQRRVSAFSFPWSGRDLNAAAVATVASIALATTASVPSAAWAVGDVGRGEQLFVGNCASCHIGGSNLVKEERTLKQDALVKFGIGTDQPSIQAFVTNSQRHKNLVFFRVEGGKLNEQQWQDVTTYISDQASGDKWE